MPYQTPQGVSRIALEGNEPPQSSIVAKGDAVGIPAEGQDETVFGPSSIVTFLRNVASDNSRHDITGLSDTDDGRHHVSNVHAPVSKANDELPMYSNNVTFLPRRRNADDLLLSYWEHLHPVFPVLHRPKFEQRYALLWIPENGTPNAGGSSSENEDAIFLATLNLVFAIGCKLSGSIAPAQRKSAAEDFYQRARRLHHPHDLLDLASVPVVQMLLLASIYLQSTKHATRCWNILGLAIRVAQTLGLHLNLSGPKSMSQVEREMRLRIWHTCATLDRCVALTLGFLVR